jgi:hypothetical protein
VELSKAAIESEMDIDKDKAKLIQAHEKTLHAMLRRIERDRREQMKHRQSDTHRLIQRNKNLLKDIYNRQTHEKRKTKQFLNWSLSDIFAFENIKKNSVTNQQPRRNILHQSEDDIRDIRLATKLVAPKSQKIHKPAKAKNIIINKRESLPNFRQHKYYQNKQNALMMLRNDPKNRNRSHITLNGRSKAPAKGTLMNVMKHRAGGKKKMDHNRSYNAHYGEQPSMIGEYSNP